MKYLDLIVRIVGASTIITLGVASIMGLATRRHREQFRRELLESRRFVEDGLAGEGRLAWMPEPSDRPAPPLIRIERPRTRRP